MAPGMSVARRPLPVSPVSFKPQPKNESARSSTPYRIYSKRKITNLPLKPTLHQAKPFGKPLIGYHRGLVGIERHQMGRLSVNPPTGVIGVDRRRGGHSCTQLLAGISYHPLRLLQRVLLTTGAAARSILSG